MQRFDLNQNWEYLESSLQNPLMVGMLQGWKKTSLPHDYAVEKARSPEAATGLDEGFMACAGLYYRKSFTVEPEIIGQRFWLEFEGIAGITEVWLNKKPIAKHNNPYTGFWVEVTNLLQAGDNEITVYTDNRTKPNSRWYVGCGIYRSVWLHMAGAVSAAPHGIRATTAALDGSSAVVEVSTALTGTADSVTYELADAEGQVLATAEGLGTVQLAANGITPWTPETPALYILRVTVTANGTADTAEQRIGIRTIQVSSKTGLLLNGQPRTMKGGCIHHDLGILGSADHAAAERRRIRLMKESGFDAIRAAHNPFGPAFLNACDELGMLVVEEAFDEWVMGRTSFGLHVTFEQCWEKDLEDMITRDYNHPCIVMWSTGNEVEERDGTADGFAWAKRLADKVRSLDASRPVSATACALFSEYGNRPAGGTTGNQALNMAYDTFAEGRDIWGPGTAPYFAPLDVAGYNYKVARYAYDAEKYPDRVIYGSESYPRAALLSWQGARDNVNVIGDFVWTAFTTTDTDIERQFQIADVKLGREGIGMAYGNKYMDFADLTAFKVDVILFVADEECMKRLHSYAEERFHGLNDDYRRYIATIDSEKIRKEYDSIVSDGDPVSKHNFRLPETIQVPHEAGGKEYRDHLFVSEATGTAKLKLNGWEAELIETEEKRPDFVCWIRNPSRGSWALCIPYEIDGEIRPTYPDFIVVRKDDRVGYVIDILEPHSPDFKDNLGKAKGFAEYARQNPGVGRIQLIRMSKDAAGKNQFKRLDMYRTAIRDKVSHAINTDELDHIFDTDGIIG